MKKKTLLFLSLIPMVLASCGAPLPEEDNTISIRYKTGRQDLDGRSETGEIYSTIQTATIDYNEFVKADNKKFNKQIAELDILCCGDAYTMFCPIYTEHDGEFVRKEGDAKYYSFLMDMGGQDPKFVNLLDDDYEADTDDVCRFILAHHDFTYLKKDYQVFFIIYCGTEGLPEWKSNFDFGYDCSNYITYSNPRKDWKDKDNHKGDDVSVYRSLTHINSYYEKYKKEGATPIYNVTGHSRGGALANICVATYLNKNIKIFGYSYAGPNVTSNPNKVDVPYLFAITNTEDPLSACPSNSIGFYRYGKSIDVPASKYASEFNEYFDYNYIHHGSSAQVMEDFLDEAIGEREFIYTAPNKVGLKYFTTEEEANEFYDDRIITCDILNLKYGKCIELSEPVKQKMSDLYVVEFKTAPVFYINCILEALSLNLIISAKLLTFLQDFAGVLFEYIPGIIQNGMDAPMKSHLCGSYLMIVRNYEE